ncbi:MAG: hypothetical protein WD058_03865 [Dehalococcoidia bacterium]
MTTPLGPPSDGPPVRPRRERPRDDALAGPADSTRPANPWPRLFAFAFGVVALVALTGLCVASFAGSPNREIRVRNTEFQLDLPKFLAVPSFGHDAEGFTYGAFLAVPFSGDSRAFLSRDPATGCNLRWNATEDAGSSSDVPLGAFVDPCSDARYAFDGRALHEGAASDLHRLDVRRESTSYVVEFKEVTLGACRGAEQVACSPPGAEVTRRIPSGALAEDFPR